MVECPRITGGAIDIVGVLFGFGLFGGGGGNHFVQPAPPTSGPAGTPSYNGSTWWSGCGFLYGTVCGVGPAWAIMPARVSDVFHIPGVRFSVDHAEQITRAPSQQPQAQTPGQPFKSSAGPNVRWPSWPKVGCKSALAELSIGVVGTAATVGAIAASVPLGPEIFAGFEGISVLIHLGPVGVPGGIMLVKGAVDTVRECF